MNKQTKQPQTLDDSIDAFCYTFAFTFRRILGLDEKEETDDETDDD
ncbi:MAG: hypothetical protein GY832_10350 [Chloroflexi bacterium]|nr:hypothetical protein [Chloroflexota bacterium]